MISGFAEETFAPTTFSKVSMAAVAIEGTVHVLFLIMLPIHLFTVGSTPLFHHVSSINCKNALSKTSSVSRKVLNASSLVLIAISARQSSSRSTRLFLISIVTPFKVIIEAYLNLAKEFVRNLISHRRLLSSEFL